MSSNAADPGSLTGQQLTDKVSKANATVTSMIGSIKVDAGSIESMDGTFSETLGDSKVTGMDMDLNLTTSGQTFELRMLAKGDKVYISGDKFLSLIKVPADKKWAIADPTSSNAGLAQMGQSLSGVLASGDTAQYAALAAAANSVKYDGEETISGVKADKYELNIDVKSAAAATSGEQQTQMQTLLSAGVTSVPMTMWLDKQGRLVQAIEQLSVQGQTVRTEVSVTSINSQVTITEPAASEVYDG